MAPQTLEERTRLIFSKQLCTHDSIVRLDPLFKQQPQCLKDSELPRAGEEIKSMLIKKATVPHAIIKTTSHPNLKALEGFRALEVAQDKRRDSSPLMPRAVDREASSLSSTSPQESPVVRSKEYRRGSSPVSFLLNLSNRSNESTPNGSPVVKAKAKAHRMRSRSTQDLYSCQSLSKSKSKSLQDLFKLSSSASSSPNSSSSKPPVKPRSREAHRKSPALPGFLLNPMAKAIHSTGSMLVALMDVGGGGGSSTLPRRNVVMRQNSGSPVLKGENRTTSM
jgi:hypothetical protein